MAYRRRYRSAFRRRFRGFRRFRRGRAGRRYRHRKMIKIGYRM